MMLNLDSHIGAVARYQDADRGVEVRIVDGVRLESGALGVVTAERRDPKTHREMVEFRLRDGRRCWLSLWDVEIVVEPRVLAPNPVSLDPPDVELDRAWHRIVGANVDDDDAERMAEAGWFRWVRE